MKLLQFADETSILCTRKSITSIVETLDIREDTWKKLKYFLPSMLMKQNLLFLQKVSKKSTFKNVHKTNTAAVVQFYETKTLPF